MNQNPDMRITKGQKIQTSVETTRNDEPERKAEGWGELWHATKTSEKYRNGRK